MSFQEAVESVFRQYANFDGRARRSEYWFFVLFVLLTSIVLSFLGGMIGGPGLARILTGLYTLVIFVPSLSLIWRRLHDSGHSGLWFLLTFIPIGQIVLLVFFCLDSQPGENEYGPNPKETDVVYWQ